MSANWKLQRGTLGSGNHFIEVSLDESDSVWLFLHSGSRGVGNKIATHHIAVAEKQMKRYFIELPDRDLSYLVEGTPEFDAYIKQMQWAQGFALANREEMMDRVIRCFAYWLSMTKAEPALVAACSVCRRDLPLGLGRRSQADCGPGDAA